MVNEQKSSGSSHQDKVVTLERFNAFLATTSPEKPCSECGASKWGIPGQETAVFKGIVPNDATLAGMDVFPVSCRHCGFTKLYAAGVIERWVEAQRHG
jgi:hypothetical protein